MMTLRNAILILLLSSLASGQTITGNGRITGQGQLTIPAPTPPIANCSDPTIHCLADCNQTTVSAAVTSAVEQDTIILPVCNVSWTQGITLTAKHVNIIGQGVGQTVITDNIDKSPGCQMYSMSVSLGLLQVDDGTYQAGYGSILVPNSTPNMAKPIRISGMTIDTGTIAKGMCWHIMILSGSHQLRIDHLSCTGLHQYDACISIDGDVWGVFDHLTVTGAPGTGSAEPILIRTQMWQAVGSYGDNSWAQPPTYGTLQQVTVEDSTIGSNGSIWCEYGSRCAVRYTSFAGMVTHGTDSLGRLRSGRHQEVYNDTFTCDNSVTIGGGSGVPQIHSFRGGNLILFNNNVMRDGSSGCQAYVSSLNIYGMYYRGWQRFAFWGGSTANQTDLDGYQRFRGACDGTSAFDGNTAVAATGTAATGSGLNTLVVSPSPNWTTNQWVGYTLHNATGTGAPVNSAGTLCSATSTPTSNYGSTTGPWGSFIVSNTANTVTTQTGSGFDCSTGGSNTFFVGDTYEIRPIAGLQCVDDIGYGSGARLDGGYNGLNWTCNPGAGGVTCSPPISGQSCRPSNACGWPNEVLDPVYAWSNTLTNTTTSATTPFGVGKQFGDTNPMMKYNVQIYNQNTNFTGAITTPDSNSTGGVGLGTLAQRPSTCTPQVGWWATDQNILYQCTATNTWSVHYQPLAHPHPFATAALLSKNGRLIETADGQVQIHLVTKPNKGHGHGKGKGKGKEKHEEKHG